MTVLRPIAAICAVGMLTLSSCATERTPPASLAPAAALSCTTGVREIVRDSPALNCLARKLKLGGSVDLPVPVQNDRAAYATECPVELARISGAGACKAKPLLAGHSIEVDYHAARDEYRITLKNSAGTAVLDNVVAVVHGSGKQVAYLSYDDGVARRYYVYLVDPDPKSAKQAKFYWVEVFDKNDFAKLCLDEHPQKALKAKAACDGSEYFELPRTKRSKLTFQTDTGGGYEPPK